MVTWLRILWDQNLDFMFLSGHKKKIGKRHLSLTKFRLCGTCWQDSGVWNCDMTKFLHSQKCDNYTTYFSTSIHPWVAPWASPVIQVRQNMEQKLWCSYLIWLKICQIDILCFSVSVLPFLKIPTMKINVVCALLFAVGIPLEFKVEIFLS